MPKKSKMHRIYLFIPVFIIGSLQLLFAQSFVTPFELSEKTQSATYFECIRFYKQLDAFSKSIQIKTFDTTDSGYPLQLVMFSNDADFNPAVWHSQNKVVILINNGIHPGEPDGIDASMLLFRDIVKGKIKIPENIVLAVIPVYNIGGCLNRNNNSRVNQNGPLSYGFRGNAQNLDLNRDFIKADSKDALVFEKIFHWLNPEILIDNHVSDGADYQHTMTLLTTQHDKLQYETGDFLHNIYEPAIFNNMQNRNWPITPYVNFEEANPEKGWEAFYDAPRFSSGYAALFETMSFIPETHMLKPFADRVESTYALMHAMIEEASTYGSEIIEKRKNSLEAIKKQTLFPLSWKVDSSQFEFIHFKGYETGLKTSEVTGMQRIFYDHSKPFDKDIKYYNTFKPCVVVEKPKAYIIPQGWNDVIERLKVNGVIMKRIANDTTIDVAYYHIDDYKSYTSPYEKHHRNYDIKLSAHNEAIQFLKGDYIIYTGNATDRYVVETLEPLGDDSFFSWNFFDAILQQKEGYSNYRWEDVAAQYLQTHPELKQQLMDKKKTDTAFAASADAQLDFVYKHSPYYEPEHLRYPVFRLIK